MVDALRLSPYKTSSLAIRRVSETYAVRRLADAADFQTCQCHISQLYPTWDQISDPGTPCIGSSHDIKHDSQARQVRATELFSHSNARSAYM